MRIEVESRSVKVTTWHIQRVLRWVPKEDLDGLGLIKVIDECPDDELDARRVPAYMWGFLYNGQYINATKKRPAQILLYANDVYFGVPKAFRVTSVATLKIARTLAHEIGHHVIASRGYIYQPSEKYRPWNGIRNPEEETMVDRYASDITERMLRHPSYKLGKSLTRMLSSLLHSAGLKNYSKQNYQLAASMFARAHSLDLENEDAGQAYRHAMEKLKTQSTSKLTAAEKEWLTNKYSSKPLTATRKPYFTGKR